MLTDTHEQAEKIVVAEEEAKSEPGKSSSDLLQILYLELRKYAQTRIANEPSGQTLQATALVHEAYVRIAGKDDTKKWNSRAHFFGAAATAMRRIMIERARHKKSIRGGGDWTRIQLNDSEEKWLPPATDLLALNEALTKLEAEHPRKAKLVELRFFAGLTNREASALLGVSTSTGDEDWRYARAWLKVAIEG
ncbi:MAG: ECF-type sigma factor [Rubripirellula sp.]